MIVDKPTLPSWKIWLLAEKVFYIWVIYGFLKTISCVFWDFKKVTLFPPFFPSLKPSLVSLKPSLLSSKFTVYFSFLFFIYTCLNRSWTATTETIVWLQGLNPTQRLTSNYFWLLWVTQWLHVSLQYPDFNLFRVVGLHSWNVE